ncbi:T/G mismatch-specific endonuclease [Micromonospora kangleipakensis]|uniref:T/G mismatch-specific endonuclease n=2 Tax=Micromonospora kangleipakensis TaxID=1077942 RepID=A0A4Q8B7K2_9ACTN|nr:T/G mismatch-specific endonuclease [Micromonospora kangleipakensis]
MVPSSPMVSAQMSRLPRRDTGPEVQLRRLLHAQGLRYRVQLPVPDWRRRTIDIAFTRVKVAVFVDGCFWHGCPEHGMVPRSNQAWWASKLEANRRRDAETTAHLQSRGWRVLRFWSHDDVSDMVVAVTRAVRMPATPV